MTKNFGYSALLLGLAIALAQQGNWQKVSWGSEIGWVERRQISTQSPTRVFPLK